MDDDNDASAASAAAVAATVDESSVLLAGETPAAAIERKVKELFETISIGSDEHLVDRMREEDLTFAQVRDQLSSNGARWAKLLNESSGWYPLHHFVSAAWDDDWGDETEEEEIAQLHELISDLIRAFPLALLSPVEYGKVGYMTPLHICAASPYWDKQDCCRLLVDFCRAACTMRSSDGNLPLQSAIENENWGVACILLEETIECGLDLSEEEYPLIHLAIGCCAPSDFIEKILVDIPGSAAMQHNGNFPLMAAVSNGMADPMLLAKLIEDYPEALKVPDQRGDLNNLPLSEAVRQFSSDPDAGYDYYEAVRVLFDGYPEALSTPNEGGELPLHLSAHFAAMEWDGADEEMRVLRLFSERYPEAHTAVTGDGKTPLHIACRKIPPKLDAVSFLVEQNENALSTADNEGCLPLHLVVQQVSYRIGGSNPVVKFLVEAFPESLKMGNNQGDLPIHLALSAATLYSNNRDFSFHPTDFIQYLLDKCPETAHHANNFGKLPLHVACSKKFTPLASIDLLVQFHSEALSSFDDDGLLPFHHACLADSTGTLMRTMLEKWHRGRGLPLTEGHDHALFFACEKHASLDVIKRLAEKSPDLFQAVANKAKESKNK